MRIPPYVVMIGTYPPPVGGRSILVQRLGALMEKHEIPYLIYSIGSSPMEGKVPYVKHVKHISVWIIRMLCSPPGKIIHYHYEEKWYFVVLLGLIKLFHPRLRCILNTHNETTLQKAFNNPTIAFVLRLALKNLVIVVDTLNTKNFLLKEGVRGSQIHCIPDALPPIENKNDELLIPHDVNKFLSQKAFIIGGNAWRLKFHDNQDLYGLDLLIEAVAKLRLEKHNVALFFAIPDLYNEQYLLKIKQRIKDLNIVDSIYLFLNRPDVPFYLFLKKMSVFIRPTNTDGDSLGVREALYYGTPVIASDVTKRPVGVHLFKNRDLDSLIKTIYKVMDLPLKSIFSNSSLFNNFEKNILPLYK